MAQPFNFNSTPITENTTLVARWKDPITSSYAGNWFRITTQDGKQYVPETLQEAEATAAARSEYVTLINTSTGIKESILINTVTTIELGPGWSSYSIANWFFDLGFYDMLSRISGYAQGLRTTDSNTMFGNFYSFNDREINVTGFKFDKGQMPALFSSLSTRRPLFTPRPVSDTGTTGVYGVIEPLYSTNDQSYIDVYAFAGSDLASVSYTKGIGFVGQYAQEWLEAFPTNSTKNFRKTYLG